VQTSTPAGRNPGEPAPSAVVAYLLLTHKDPDQVMALADRIHRLSPTSHVVVHHDRKADTLPWDGAPPHWAHLVERVEVEWGDWSIVEATLRMFRFAHEELNAAWFVVISGEHWPVVSLESWERDLAERSVDAILPAQLLPRRLHFGPSDRDENRFLARCVHRWFHIKRPRSDVLHKALAGFSKISLWTHPLVKLEYSLRSDAWFVGVPRRRGPVRNWDLYKGSEWIACNARAAAALLRVDPALTEFFRRSHIPDESYMQTVLRREAGLVVESSDVTWVPPEPEQSAAGWMLLKTEQLAQIRKTGVAFARKVDASRNPEVIVALDAYIDAEPSRPSPTGRPVREEPLDSPPRLP
jgi:hypothetical protein